MAQDKEIIYVIGHINPDTDSICSAIAYADLKRKLTKGKYIAKRAGQINSETQYVLNRFGVNPPSYLSDVRTQVKDIEYHKVKGVNEGISLKRAWEQMRDENLSTLPVVEGGKLDGLIEVADITKSYMDVYDNRVLATAETSYLNLKETLEGEIIVGDENAVITHGKVLVAAANPDLMENYIDENDIVILGNRYESQLCAIEMKAQCIIVCEGATVSYTISKLAQERGCTIVKTPYDTYTVARVINQSISIKYFMKREGVVAFQLEDYIDDVKEVMAKKRYRDFPVLDQRGNLCGSISRRNLLNARKKKLILVDHNERSQAVDGLKDAEILEIIDHHKLGSVETINPVYFRNQPLGCTATIIYQMYKENGVSIEPRIAGLLCSAILSDTLIYQSPTCTPVDKEAAEELAKIAGIETGEHAKEMFLAGSDLRNKAPEEVFYQDFKKFIAGDVVFGVGQINSMDGKELENIKEKLLPYLEKAYKDHPVSMIFFMLTNIMEKSTEMLYCGEGAKDLLLNAFPVTKDGGDGIILEGVVSRKKQLIPALMLSLQKDGGF